MRAGFVYAVAGVLTFTAVYSCCCGAPLIWDGAFQFDVSLIRQTPFVYCSRFHTYLLWQPFVLLSRYTENQSALCLAFGLPFLLAPVVGLLVSWWLVRREAPWLILWVVFGITAGPLPGQIFIINDSIFQQHLFWPLFVAVFVRLDWRKWLVLAVLAVFQFVHPVGFLLLSGATGAALLLAWADRPHRRRLLSRAVVGAAVAAAAVLKAISFPDPYAKNEMTWDAAVQRWDRGVRGEPLLGLVFMWAAATLLFVAVRARGNAGGTARAPFRALVILAFVCALAGGGVWVHWAQYEQRWALALEYRRWVVPLTLPFFLLCWLDQFLRAWRGRRSRGASTAAEGAEQHWIGCRVYPVMCQLLAGVFAVVLIVQSTLFGSMVRRLRDDIQNYPGVLVPDLYVSKSPMESWGWHTAMEHWAVTDLGIVIQGKHPKKLLVGPDWARYLYHRKGGKPPFFYGDPPSPPNPNPGGWYDIRPLLHGLPHKPPFLDKVEKEDRQDGLAG